MMDSLYIREEIEQLDLDIQELHKTQQSSMSMASVCSSQKKRWSAFHRTRDGSVPPSARCSHTATHLGDCIYFIGGGLPNIDAENSEFQHLHSIDILSLAEAKWSKIESNGKIFTARRGHSANLYKARFIVVFGGICGASDDTLSNEVLIFDVERGTWSKPETRGTPPSPRRGHISCIHNGKLLVLGGFSATASLMSFPINVYVLDLETYEWIVRGAESVDTFDVLMTVSNACEVIDKKLMFLGTILNPATQNFSDAAKLITMDLDTLNLNSFTVTLNNEEISLQSFTFHSSAAIGQEIFILNPNKIENLDGIEELSQVTVINVSDLSKPLPISTLVVDEEGEEPLARNAASFTAVGTSIVLFGGGIYPTTYFNTVHVLEFPVAPPIPALEEKKQQLDNLNINEEQESQDTVCFLIEGREVVGQRSKLVASSPVWAALLEGGFREHTSKLPIDMSACGLTADLFAKFFVKTHWPIPHRLELLIFWKCPWKLRLQLGKQLRVELMIDG